MKKLLLVLLWLPLAGVAQPRALPLDPSVRTGVLPNGLTYYIKQNKKPEARAQLRLALKAGSLQELDGQNGLAHFTEHMCFNGTKNFEKQSLIDYLEGIGTQFGADLNAYTTFDRTVYQLLIPTDMPDIVDNGLLILADWAQRVQMEPEEIDKERGVVLEEMRTHMGLSERLTDSTYHLYAAGSRFTERMPIGKKEVLEGFAHDTLLHYYRTWYRPELMAVIAVGDFDPAEMERKVKETFGPLEARKGPMPTSYPIQAWTEPRVQLIKDAESPFSMLSVAYLVPPLVTRTREDYRLLLLRYLASTALQERLAARAREANPPFITANTGIGQFVADNWDSWYLQANLADGGAARGLEALVTELERMRRYGLQPDELERGKLSVMGMLEKRYAERDATDSEQLVDELVEYHLKGVAMPGFEAEMALAKELMPQTTLVEVNEYIKELLKSNVPAVGYLLPDKPGAVMPTKAATLALLEQVRKQDIQPLAKVDIDRPLIAEKPKEGKIVAEKTHTTIGVTELTLSNGARVLLKPTDFKQDEILIQAYSPGGTSCFEDPAYLDADNAASIVAESGLGTFDQLALEKKLAGKEVSVTPYIGKSTHGLNASSTKKDLETAMQLIYLTHTQSRSDRTAFENWRHKKQQDLEDADRLPEQYFFRQYTDILADGQLRYRNLKAEDYAKMDPDQAMVHYRSLFAHAAGFTYVITGSFDPVQIRPLIQQYIASIPAGTATEVKARERKLVQGPMRRELTKGEDPKSLVMLANLGAEDYTQQYLLEQKATFDVLDIMIREELREKRGGIYGAMLQGSKVSYPKPYFSSMIFFFCAPDRVAELAEAAMEEMKKLAKNGPSDTNLQKVRETMRRNYELKVKENKWWLEQLIEYQRYGWDIKNLGQDGTKAIDKLNAKIIQSAAKRYLDTEHTIQIILNPEKAK
ncbi:MAG: insulinase family protein [Bacteroidetes bacterium]|jgi:zinc protease|nr:insulinase family protein [Bacteroidota bacterium]